VDAAMNPRLPLLALALASLAAIAAEPAVEVTFTDPEKFSDLRTSRLATDRERLSLAEALREHVVARAPQYLPKDTRLAVTITDVDMAGEFRPMGASLATGEVRIVKDIYPPRVDLEFRLARADGTVEREGKRQLRDVMFLSSSSGRVSDLLRYEKDLLDRWLQREFAAKR
jgi:Protein of unknown function (DUF3016)